MCIEIGSEGQAYLRLQVRKVMAAFDNSVDVKSAIEEILDEVYSVALSAGVQSGVTSITQGTFVKAVKDAVRTQ
jgi:hypothetical protein